MTDTLTIATWNLQGSAGLDVQAVAARLLALAPAPGDLDVVVLQEVQRRQAHRLAEALGMAGRAWAFKHWPIRRPSEGLAIVTRHDLTAVRSVCIQRAPWWNWRRRIVVLARIGTPAGEVAVADVHLSPHELDERRRQEAARVVGELTAFGNAMPSMIVGDLNALPGSAAPSLLEAAGWTDAWAALHPDGDASAIADRFEGATNWTSGPRVGRPPTQRLDYVLLSGRWIPERITVPRLGEPTDDAWAVLSDHLPVCATVRWAAATTGTAP